MSTRHTCMCIHATHNTCDTAHTIQYACMLHATHTTRVHTCICPTYTCNTAHMCEHRAYNTHGWHTQVREEHQIWKPPCLERRSGEKALPRKILNILNFKDEEQWEDFLGLPWFLDVPPQWLALRGWAGLVHPQEQSSWQAVGLMGQILREESGKRSKVNLRRIEQFLAWGSSVVLSILGFLALIGKT